MSRAEKRALVADDDRATARLVGEILARQGYQVELVHDGGAAWARLRQGPPVDLVILDVLMPGRTGVEVLREARAAGWRVPVVVMSSFLSEEVRLACGSLGPVALIEKPFWAEDLRRAVAEAHRQPAC
ncbi:MAG: response regulator [Planctomycetota bacterium]